MTALDAKLREAAQSAPRPSGAIKFKDPSAPRGRPPSQADLIVELADELGVELVHDSAQVAYAIMRLDDVRAVYTVRSFAFTTLLAKEFFDRNEKVPRAAALSDARAVLEGRGIHAGRLVNVGLRIAGDEDEIDVDLGDALWRMAHVKRDGWSIKSHGDRFFRRAPGMLALPEPVHGGNLAELRNFVRVKDDDYPLLEQRASEGVAMSHSLPNTPPQEMRRTRSELRWRILAAGGRSLARKLGPATPGRPLASGPPPSAKRLQRREQSGSNR